MNRFKPIALLTLLFGVAGCASTAPQPHPFIMSKEGILSRVKVVAVAPVRLSDNFPDATRIQEQFEDSIVAELTALGFQTVPSAEYERALKSARDSVGPIFDPVTGKADEEKSKKVVEQCRQELATKFHADAMLYPSLDVFSVPFSQSYASWDGTHEWVTTTGIWERAIFGAGNGTVSALSLCVLLSDMDGNNLYSKCGGIQLLAKVKAGHFEKLDQKQILADTGRNTNAVALAFKSFHEQH